MLLSRQHVGKPPHLGKEQLKTEDEPVQLGKSVNAKGHMFSRDTFLLVSVVAITLAVATSWAMQAKSVVGLEKKQLLLMEYIEKNGGRARPNSYFGKGVVGETDVQTVTLNSHLISEGVLEDLQIFDNIKHYVFENIDVTEELFSRIPNNRKVVSLVFVECHLTGGCLVGTRLCSSLLTVGLRGGTHDCGAMTAPKATVDTLILKSTPASHYPFSVLCDFESIDTLQIYADEKSGIHEGSLVQRLNSCRPSTVRSMYITSVALPRSVSSPVPLFTHILVDACAIEEVHFRGFSPASFMNEIAKTSNPPKVYSVKE